MTTKIIFCFGWVICAILTLGMEVAYFQNRWPSLGKEHYRDDLGFGILFGLITGPVGTIVSFMMNGFGRYGWQLTPRKDECSSDS